MSKPEMSLTPLESLALSRCSFRQDWGGHWREITNEEEIKGLIFLGELAQANSEGIFEEEADERAERVSRELINAYRSAKAKIEGREPPAPFQTKTEIEAARVANETPSQTRARRLAELEESERELEQLLNSRGKVGR